jgi:Na+-driven multidrug efflux pump
LGRVREGFIRLCQASDCDWHWPTAATVIRIGLPNAFSMTLFPFVYMVLIRIPVQYGAHQVAALRIGHTVEGMSFFLAIGCSMATATLVGQNLGAGKPERAARAAWLTASLVSAVLAVFSLAFGLLPESIAAIFTPEPATVQASAVYLRILAFSQVFMGLEIALGGGFNGAGDTVWPMLVNVPLNLLRIPAAYLLADSLGWGVTGVWWAISGSSVLKGLLLTGLFASGRWARRRV